MSRHRHAPLLAEDVEAGELQRGQDLRAVVVERRRRIGDQEAHLLELRRVVADQIRLQRRRTPPRRVSPPPPISPSPINAFVGLDFDDGADEPPPMAPVGVAQRRFERNGDRGGADVGDLHDDTTR